MIPFATFTIKAKDFIPLMSSLDGIIDLLEFKVSKDGIHVSQMDCSHVSLFSLHFPLESFTHFKLNQENEVFYAGFYVPAFLKFFPSPFKQGSRNGDLTMSLKEKDSPWIDFCLRQHNAKITTTFSLKNKVDSIQTFAIPRHAYSTVVQMKRCTFASAIQTMVHVGDVFHLKMTAYAVSFETMDYADPPQPCRIQLDPYVNNPSMTLKEYARDTEEEYSTRYVHAMLKCIAPASMISLSQQEDKPLKISCVLKKNIVLEYFLAPKIKN